MTAQQVGPTAHAERHTSAALTPVPVPGPLGPVRSSARECGHRLVSYTDVEIGPRGGSDAGKYLRTDRFQATFVPGLCLYKALYVWLDFCLPEGGRAKNLGWMYWLPNPRLPFIWFRVAVAKSHPELTIEEFEADLPT